MWAKLDDRFADHPKVVRASDRAFRAHVRAMCYAAGNLTGGRLPRQWALATIGARIAAQLVSLGLWEPTEDGDYLIHDWDDYNPSPEEVIAMREARAEAGRIGGIRSGESRRSKSEAKDEAKSEAIALANGKQKRTPSPSPSPSQKETSSSSSDLRNWLSTKGLGQKYIDHALDVLDRNSNQVQNERAYVLKCARDLQREDEDEGAKREQAGKNAEIVKRTREREEAGAIRAPQSQQSQPPKTTPEKAKNSASRTQARTSVRKQSESEETERARQLRELEAWNPDPPTSSKEAEAIVRKKVVSE